MIQRVSNSIAGRACFIDLDYVTEESVVPDVRKHELKDHAESIRHYIDLEGYKVNNTATLPVDMKSATARFSNDTLSKYGTLPWTIVEYMKLLTEAFRHKNKAEILFLASDLGHYIGDAHMPLHTSINHDGQFTNQDGIHGLWEAQLPELFGAQYHLNVAPNAQYITNITETTMSLVDHSHALVDSLLDADKKTRMGKSESQIFTLDANAKKIKNKYGQPVFQYAYAAELNSNLNDMVERQMIAAIHFVASYWLTAWINAGKPDLSTLDNMEAIKQTARKMKKTKWEWMKNGIIPVNTQDEY